VSQFREGIRLFAQDMQRSMPLSVTLVIAVLAFVLTLAVATGFHPQ
jgi:multisubunit Na+/H+ antiporter MnhF subunit